MMKVPRFQNMKINFECFDCQNAISKTIPINKFNETYNA
jgi:hypothetical protein